MDTILNIQSAFYLHNNRNQGPLRTKDIRRKAVLKCFSTLLDVPLPHKHSHP